MGAERSIWEVADLATPMAVRVAATLRLADHIAAGATTVGALASACGVDAGRLGRLVQHLAFAGVLAVSGGAVALTPLGQQLLDDHPASLRGVLDIGGALGRGDLSFVHLLDAVTSGEAVFPRLFGRSFWDDVAADPARHAQYDAHMGADVARWAPRIASALDWAAFGSVVDVGGGDGTLLASLLATFPTLRGTVLDRPATVDAARDRFAAAGVDDRASAVAGDFFEALPAGAGAYLLCAIVHDWDDDAAVAILRRCGEAAAGGGGGGSVVVVERAGDEGELPSSEMDLRMLVYFGAAERSVDALVALAERAGLQLSGRHHPGGHLAVLHLRPA